VAGRCAHDLTEIGLTEIGLTEIGLTDVGLTDVGLTGIGVALRTRVTKQALGQLAGQLADRGYVEVVPDPGDGRAKLIRCTELGERARSAIRAIAVALEDRWRAEVGAARYAVFREVLAELAGSGPRSEQEAEWRGGPSVRGGNIDPSTPQDTPVTGTTEQQEAGDQTT
jgi:hypothetical protein